jgi:hypothetical protein
MTHLLRSALAPVVQRRRNYLFLRATVWIWAVLVLGGFFASRFAPPDERLYWALGIVVGAVFFGLQAWLWKDRWQPDYRQIARSIEQRHPELHALLITAVEQVPEAHTGELNFLQARVVQSAIDESRKHQWVNETPWSRWLLLLLLQVALLPALFLIGTRLISTGRFAPTVNGAPGAVVEPQVAVTPGDVELERGSGLIVTARFERQVPSAATLVIQPQNAPAERLELTRNLNDPVYGGGLPEVNGPFTYRVEYGDKATRDFTVKVFEHPRLERADATLTPPAYTKLPQKELLETRRVSGVEGSKTEVAFQLNKPVASAWLQAKDGSKLPLAVSREKALAQLKDFTLAASGAYELHLTDADGRANKLPETFAIDVLPNRRPELKRKLPRGDGRVSPLQEVQFEASAWDDFGLLGWGLSFTLPNGEDKEVALGTETAADQRVEGRHMLKLEPLHVSHDELISWHLWADDTGPDGKPRRTTSDIYFAEVRPFEEIFRVDDSGGGPPEGGGEGENITKLAELQKQIIAATWNLQRRDQPQEKKGAKLDFDKDLPVIRDNQSQAAEEAEALSEKLEQPKSKTIAEAALREMREAVDKLTQAQPAPTKLPDAVPPEQRAYAQLLKLAAHEFAVKKQRGGGGGEQQGGPKQEMLDQLELKEDRDRYETKSEAGEEKQVQQEQLAMLNRLKELAQRQQDINERIKELQTALQEAKSEAEREEAKRQLKRLQEEQQQMLADMDELKQSMEQAQNQGELAQEKERLEQSRREAQKAGEAMRQEKPTEALAAGTRSERELQELRDDFRKKNSTRFREQMRDLRADARQLSSRQEEIGNQLEEATKNKETALKALDAQDPREKLGEQLAQQQGALDKLQKGMREVSEQAETAEPLLARELYDSLRKSAQAGTDDTLKKSAALAARGYTSQAKPFEQKARKEVGELKEGVERAAEAVLGNEADALRQARQELDRLAEAINREIARARPDLAQNEKGKEGPGEGEKNPAEAKAGQEKTASKDGGEAKEPAEGENTQAAGAQKGAGKKAGEAGEKGEPKAEQNAAGEKGKLAGKGKEAGGQQGDGEKSEKGQGGESGKEPGPKSGKGAKGQTAGNGKGAGQPQTGPTGPTAGEPGSPSGEQAPGKPGSSLRELASGPLRPDRGAGGGGGDWRGGGIDHEEGPLTGENFVKWSDRLRNVEEMLETRELREQVAQIREDARTARAEFKRHANEPQWDLVKMKIGKPLAELRDRVAEELARKDSKESLVPIDRDPVPPKYAERVRRYYEELGK